MGKRFYKHVAMAAGAITLLIAFNNCGEGFVTGGMVERTLPASFFSRAPGESCETALLRVYEATYFPFVSQTCSGCHVNGPGIGTFAHPNSLTSFNSFMATGATKITSQAVNDNHKPPYTGAHNTGYIESAKASWNPAQEQYITCVSENGGAIGGGIVKSVSKVVPANITANNYARMEWDLETESPAKLPLVAGIEVRLAVISGTPRGYEFRNPTLRAKTVAAGSFNARSLGFYLNDERQSDVTTYNNLEVIVAGITNINLSPGTSNALAVFPAAPGTRVAIEFSSLKSTTETPTTPTPTPTPPPADLRVTYAMLSVNGGIFANSCFSCHSGAAAKAGLDLTNYTVARTAAQNIRARVNNAANPMPVGMLLPPAQRDQINAWVDAGAPQN